VRALCLETRITHYRHVGDIENLKQRRLANELEVEVRAKRVGLYHCVRFVGGSSGRGLW